MSGICSNLKSNKKKLVNAAVNVAMFGMVSYFALAATDGMTRISKEINVQLEIDREIRAAAGSDYYAVLRTNIAGQEKFGFLVASPYYTTFTEYPPSDYRGSERLETTLEAMPKEIGTKLAKALRENYQTEPGWFADPVYADWKGIITSSSEECEQNCVDQQLINYVHETVYIYPDIDKLDDYKLAPEPKYAVTVNDAEVKEKDKSFTEMLFDYKDQAVDFLLKFMMFNEFGNVDAEILKAKNRLARWSSHGFNIDESMVAKQAGVNLESEMQSLQVQIEQLKDKRAQMARAYYQHLSKQ